MSKAISYSLFGYGKERAKDCFDFNSYLRGLLICVRVNKLLYPEWTTVLNVDKQTYEQFMRLFSRLPITIKVYDAEPLTKAMLWRLKPIFEQEQGHWKYTHVLCRDIDSPATYREVQAVQYWMNRDKAAHAITDSVSHTIPLMGGMIGFRPEYFSMRTGYNSWGEMFNGCTIDFNRKGADQDFLNQYIYPKFAQPGNDSITQHYYNGMPNTFLGDYRTCTCPPVAGHSNSCPNNMDINLPAELKESNSICGHIGASGYYTGATHSFLNKHRDKFEEIRKAEEGYEDIFYWIKEDLF